MARIVWICIWCHTEHMVQGTGKCVKCNSMLLKAGSK